MNINKMKFIEDSYKNEIENLKKRGNLNEFKLYYRPTRVKKR